ncbi:imidazole glycerol phosphate synthase subunit HisH [Christiangramia forsetii]|uniref:Imidazole glycerol phosphate synthase subunit HisH n=2 Tax=Christiangramia forsetii TaxID=411153 RepID=A0M285_CHRFK|nr:imidazole glycerol phosphate synthase subunit HisH [Christiangramia forsetii]GGG39809.1 imidazole glycerol phosphate synthase subunit HisH [Christiangramia forsetii]CAL66730.1 imidazole glycerol phosphate synthase subunit HisH [Christiangramia forsetii KT0803]
MKENQKIVIIDYGAGNIQSIKFAIKRLGFEAELSSDASEIRNADKVIFPGVGEAGSAMRMLKSTGLDEVIPTLKQPVLGICLGMQLMCNSSEEGKTKGLGIFDAEVKRFSNHVKVPQIGWNQISNLESALFEKVKEGEYVYLVHSYYVPECKDEIARTEYGVNYSTALHRDNFYGVQFHPEKSSITGEQILKNFLKLELAE